LGPADILQPEGLSSSYDIDNMDVDFDIDGEGDSREIVGSSGQTYVLEVRMTDALWQIYSRCRVKENLKATWRETLFLTRCTSTS